MLQHIKNYSTYQFFTFYYMLKNKHKQYKITAIGYYPVFMTLNYIKYNEVQTIVKQIYFTTYLTAQQVNIYEDNIEIDCNTMIGIKIIFINDPINVVKLLHKINDIGIFACQFVAQNGHLECLKYIHNNCKTPTLLHRRNKTRRQKSCEAPVTNLGCHFNTKTCNLLASGGHLECLKYAHNNGYPCNDYTCTLAAIGGHLECLKYLYENNCNFSLDITSPYKACNDYINNVMKIIK